ncbi:MAG: hypothetical protein JO146_05910 [Candidatus Eremiobacteraeota bacterium]|nr:hypothetical protein [Candidatus Eremiobacteraeota bacterium]
MMTHDLEVSIVAAPLEAIDRRALSQAWYSALHLAAPARQTSIRPQAHRPAAGPPAAYRVLAHPRRNKKPYLHSKCNVRVVRRGRCAAEAPTASRIPQSRLAARIARAFAAASAPRRATFSLGPGSARVHVVLQATLTRTMLVALCPPHLRADVGQALAQARAALAARGIALDLRSLEGRTCF